MVKARSVLAAFFVAAILPLAGCFAAEAGPDELTFSAQGGRVSEGWAYDGAGIAVASATLSGTLKNSENTGSVLVAFNYAGSAWTIDFSNFAEGAGKEFMDGGVAFDLTEHGDSGVADTSIPKILARIAAWGTAKVTRDGQLLSGAMGSDAWSAHLMVSDTTVRDINGKISKEGGAPYDPAAPADAVRVEGDPQAFLWIKSPDGEAAKRAPVPVNGAVSFAGPESTQSIDVPAEKGANVFLNVTGSPQAGPAPLGVGTVVFELVDAEGNVLQSSQGTVTPNTPAAGTLVAENAPGPLTVRIKGAGAFTASVEGTIAFDDHPFLVLTWDDVTLA